MRDGARTICFLTPTRLSGHGDSLGVLRTEYEDVAAAFRELGFRAVIADAETPDFLRTVLAIGSEPHSILFGHMFYDMTVVAGGLPPIPLADVLPASFVSYVGDHPIAPFMRGRVSHLHHCQIAFVFDPDFIEQIRVLNPEVRVFRHLPGLSFGVPNVEPRPFAERAFDAVIAFRYKPLPRPAQIEPALTDPVLGEALTATEEALLDDCARPLFAVFSQNLAATAGITPAVLRAEDPARFAIALDALHYVDFFIRNERRRRLVERLLSQAGRLKILFVGCSPDEFGAATPAGADVRVVQHLPFVHLMEAYRDARFVVHSHPTYPGALHERFLNGAACGAVVVSEPVPVYREHFVEGQEWFAVREGFSLAEVASVMGAELEAMGRRAWDKVWQKFSPLAHARRILAALEDLAGARMPDAPCEARRLPPG